MSRRLSVTALGVLVLGTLFWLTVLRPEPVPVQVVAVDRGRVESTLTNTKAGTVRARRRA